MCCPRADYKRLEVVLSSDALNLKRANVFIKIEKKMSTAVLDSHGNRGIRQQTARERPLSCMTCDLFILYQGMKHTSWIALLFREG